MAENPNPNHDPNTHNPNTPEPGGPLVFTQLETGPVREMLNEWERIAGRRRTLRQVNEWPFITTEVTHLDQVLVMAGFGRAFNDDEGDRFLWELVRRAENDELAALIVVHRVLPAIMSIAARRGRIHPGGPTGAMNDLLGHAWIVVRTYPHARRPRKVAANIALDIEYHTFVRPYRLKRVETVAIAPEILCRVVHDEHEENEGRNVRFNPQESADELARILDDAEQDGVEPHHMVLLRRLASGETGTEIAAEEGVSPRTIRTRRRAALDAVIETMQRI